MTFGENGTITVLCFSLSCESFNYISCYFKYSLFSLSFGSKTLVFLALQRNGVQKKIILLFLHCHWAAEGSHWAKKISSELCLPLTWLYSPLKMLVFTAVFVFAGEGMGGARGEKEKEKKNSQRNWLGRLWPGYVILHLFLNWILIFAVSEHIQFFSCPYTNVYLVLCSGIVSW